MKLVSIGFVVSAMLAACATPATAQDRDPSWWERLIGVDFRVPLCEVGLDIVQTSLPGLAAATIETLARGSGLCPSTPPSEGPADGPATALPGLQVKVVSVKGTAANPVIAAGTPDSIYARGDGFALIVATNAPGYLEVWSLDDTAADRFVEGIVLDPSNASVVSLPKVVEGAYRFSDAGGRDMLRLRFLPCRPTNPQSFEAVANERVAQSVAAMTPQVAAMTGQLPTCTFNAGIDRTQPQDALFRRSHEVHASFSSQTSLYTAVLDPAAAPSARTLSVDIELKRQ